MPWRMMRTASLLPLSLLLGAANPSPGMPDVIEGGRVAAQLSDWQTVAFFLMIIIVTQAVERMAAGWQARSTARLLASAMEKLADASSSRGDNISANQMLIQSNQADIKADLRSLLDRVAK